MMHCTGLCYNQLNNNLISQAATMTTNGLPNDVLSNLDPLALIIFIPICDLVVRNHHRDNVLESDDLDVRSTRPLHAVVSSLLL
jgi:dipeptide/tripeptide permease